MNEYTRMKRYTGTTATAILESLMIDNPRIVYHESGTHGTYETYANDLINDILECDTKNGITVEIWLTPQSFTRIKTDYHEWTIWER